MAPFQAWKTSEVVQELKVLGFGQYSRQFQANEICGCHIPLLTDDHLREIGVASVGHRILLLRRFSDIANDREITAAPQEPISARSKVAPAKPAPAPEQKKPAPRRADAPKPEPVHRPESAMKREAPAKPESTAKADPAPHQPERRKTDPPAGRQSKLQQTRDPKSSAAAKRNQAEPENADVGNVQCQHCGKKFPPATAAAHMRVCARVAQVKAGKR